jgi:vancomycin resistance protein YoaR
MKSYSIASDAYHAPRPVLPRIFSTLLGGALVFGMLLAGVVFAYDAYFTGKIYPGVSVAGLDLSGLPPAQAAVLLIQHLDYPTHGRILLRDGEQLWVATPSQLGFNLDPVATALAMHSLGRNGGPLNRIVERFAIWYFGKNMPPQYVFDERTAQGFLQQIAAQTDLPTVEASLSIEGLEVVGHPGQVGRSLDIPATVQALYQQLQNMQDGEVPLVIHEKPPAILNVDAQAELARKILSAPLVLSLPDAQPGDPGPWTFGPEELAKMLTIARVPGEAGDSYQVGLDTASLQAFLTNLAPQLARTQQNARFIFNDDTRQLEVIQPSVVGRSLAVDATVQAINQALLAAEHEVPLAVVTTPPEVPDTSTAEQLGITELVSSQTSYFYGSTPERIQNIQTASASFHGVLVAPGATFSMAAVMGDVSLDNGYAEAWIIFGGRTIQGVGGGVCQVSTTFFRTAFFGGYPIVERHPHAYRVGYYEQTAGGGYDTSLAGLDATVFVPMVDFKFTNDRSSWLLMETYVNPAARTLTWKFYSAPDGRTVSWDTTGPQNIVGGGVRR